MANYVKQDKMKVYFIMKAQFMSVVIYIYVVLVHFVSFLLLFGISFCFFHTFFIVFFFQKELAIDNRLEIQQWLNWDYQWEG